MQIEIVMVKESELRTYEYHLNGAEVVAVFNHQDGVNVFRCLFAKTESDPSIRTRKANSSSWMVTSII